MESPPSIAKSRPLGTTESNWCKALDGGTGVTVIGLLFQQPLPLPALRAALSDVLASQPLLRARIVDRNGRLWFDVADDTAVDVDVIQSLAAAEDPRPTRERVDAEDFFEESDSRPERWMEAGEAEDPVEESNNRQEWWLRLVENEMNILFPAQKPYPVMQVRLFCLPRRNSLLILRMHPAAADLASGTPICSALLSSIQSYIGLEKSGRNLQEILDRRRRVSNFSEKDVRVMELPAVEDAIPPGQANKSFWARGMDVVGYGLGSMRHAYLPFQTPGKPSGSRLMRSIFSEIATKQCLEACARRKTDLYGVLSAAALKAVTSFKKVGSKGEHYGVVVLMNCRNTLQPEIADSIVGFYHSAIMKTTHASETIELWELAERCTRELNEALKNRKQFTDMADLNMLMVQAMAHPNLTPSGSMRTALLSIFSEPVIETSGEAVSALQVKDYVTCSSIHGVGPCLALYPFLRDGSLRISYVYCTPLFSRSTMQTLLDSIYATITSLE